MQVPNNTKGNVIKAIQALPWWLSVKKMAHELTGDMGVVPDGRDLLCCGQQTYGARY